MVALNLAARIRSFGSDEFCLKAQSAELKTAQRRCCGCLPGVEVVSFGVADGRRSHSCCS
jgi:hypothetical protein